MSTSNPDKKPHPAQATYDANRKARQDAFLEAYSQCGTVTHAAKAAGIDRSTFQHWMEQDPSFPTRRQYAYEAFRDFLQESAVEKVSWRNPVTGRHDPRDNILHLAMLNAHLPELYRPENVRTLNDNRSVTIVHNYHHSVSEPQGTPIPTDSSHELPSPPTETRHKDTTESVIDTSSDELSVD